MKKEYLIWSNEHAAWWAPDHGYVLYYEVAGNYTYDEAIAICRNARIGKAEVNTYLPEIPVLISDVESILRKDVQI